MSAERVFNLLAGLSVLSWAVLGIRYGGEPIDLSPTRLCIAAQHLCVGVFFLLRSPLSAEGSIAEFARCVPSIILCYAIFVLSRPLASWPLEAECLFAGATVIVILSFLSLGRSFAILPAVRGLVRGGPYRWLRHPAYAGELLMALACYLAVPGLASTVLLLLLLPATMWRIHTEEALLLRESNYAEYANSVHWRLVPGVW
jgi:protein-S-isoprenylcysteine O-methyltransferase Ste14